MEYVLAPIGGIYMWGVFIFWAVFWWTKTDKSQAAMQRRTIALGHGLIWPYHVFQYFAGRKQAAAEREQRRIAEQRIFGDSPVVPPQASAPTDAQRRVSNPFDS